MSIPVKMADSYEAGGCGLIMCSHAVLYWKLMVPSDVLNSSQVSAIEVIHPLC